MNFSAPNSSSHTDADWCESEQDARRALEAARGPRDSVLLNEALIKLRDAWTARANAALAHAEEHGSRPEGRVPEVPERRPRQ